MNKTTIEVEKLRKLNEVITKLEKVLTEIDEQNHSEYIKKIGDPELALAYLATVEMMEENMDNFTQEFDQFKEKVYDNLDPLTELM